MDRIRIIVGIAVVIAYMAAAVCFIRSCSSIGDTVFLTGVAIVLGALLAVLIEYIVAICIIGLGLCMLSAFLT